MHVWYVSICYHPTKGKCKCQCKKYYTGEEHLIVIYLFTYLHTTLHCKMPFGFAHQNPIQQSFYIWYDLCIKSLKQHTNQYKIGQSRHMQNSSVQIHKNAEIQQEENMGLHLL